MSNAFTINRPASARRRGLWGGGASTSSQRPLWSKDEEWPTETSLPERTETVPPGAQPLSRYMRKRHGVLDWNLERKAEFATRYVHVDDMNGRIYYTGNPNLKEKVALSLGEVASVRALPKVEAGDDFCFEVACRPHRLVIAARNARDCEHWVSGLRSRCALWKTKFEREVGPRALPNVRRDGRIDPQRPWRIEGARSAW